ncbi:MAG: hypothetical protein Q8R96_11775 [Bacteroidota bacterium]|nr:hypothetical protein [Bacteroidota bacterium]
MTTKELRNKVIRKINQVDDEEILNEIYRLLEDSIEDDDIFQLTENHVMAIEEAKKQIDQGESMTNEQANLEIGEWLNR